MRDEVLSEAHVVVCEEISREREREVVMERREHGERSGRGGGEFIGARNLEKGKLLQH